MSRCASLVLLAFTACAVDRTGLGGTLDPDAGTGADAHPIDGAPDFCPGAALDVCDGLDNDCDESTHDGSGDPRVGHPCDGPDDDLCPEGTAFCMDATLGCTDTTPSTPEICNGVDDDCDGMIDEAGATGTTTSWVDADHDGYGDPTMPVDACSTPVGNVATGGDCADHDEHRHPGVSETCNGLDDDCNGMIDDGVTCPCPSATYGGHSYMFCGTHSNFADAETLCRGSGYWLVTVDDDAENTWVATTSQAIENAGWWVGLNDLTIEGSWRWVSGLPDVYPPHWDTGEPNGGVGANCAVVGGTNAYWHDRACTDTYAYVCEAGGP